MPAGDAILLPFFHANDARLHHRCRADGRQRSGDPGSNTATAATDCDILTHCAAFSLRRTFAPLMADDMVMIAARARTLSSPTPGDLSLHPVGISLRQYNEVPSLWRPKAAREYRPGAKPGTGPVVRDALPLRFVRLLVHRAAARRRQTPPDPLTARRSVPDLRKAMRTCATRRGVASVVDAASHRVRGFWNWQQPIKAHVSNRIRNRRLVSSPAGTYRIVSRIFIRAGAMVTQCPTYGQSRSLRATRR